MTSLACQDTLYPVAELPQNERQQPCSGGVILLAVGSGNRSRSAFRWATELSRSLGMKLRPVHAAIERAARGSPAAADGGGAGPSSRGLAGFSSRIAAQLGTEAGTSGCGAGRCPRWLSKSNAEDP